jgi:hypothetical protein
VQEPHPNREDHIEAALAEVDVLKARNEELGIPRCDVRCVSPRRRLDHPRRSIDRGQSASFELLTDQRRGHPVTTSDFKDAVVGANTELINDGL